MIFKIHDTNLDFRLALSNSFSPTLCGIRFAALMRRCWLVNYLVVV